MTGIGSARVNVDADELVLEAIISIWLPNFLLTLLLGLDLLLSELLLICLLLTGETTIILLILLLLESILFTHDFVEAIWLQVKYVREGAERVDFIVLERVEVEANPLQVHNEDIGRRCNHSTLLEVYLAAAAVAVVVIDDLTFDELFKGLLDRFHTLDGQGEVQVVLHAIFDFTALGADHLTALLASEDTIDEVLAGRGLQSLL